MTTGVPYRPKTVSIDAALVIKLRAMAARHTLSGAARMLGTDTHTLGKVLGINQLKPTTAARLTQRISEAS